MASNIIFPGPNGVKNNWMPAQPYTSDWNVSQ
jgi:hypothetical protein